MRQPTTTMLADSSNRPFKPFSTIKIVNKNKTFRTTLPEASVTHMSRDKRCRFSFGTSNIGKTRNLHMKRLEMTVNESKRRRLCSNYCK